MIHLYCFFLSVKTRRIDIDNRLADVLISTAIVLYGLQTFTLFAPFYSYLFAAHIPISYSYLLFVSFICIPCYNIDTNTTRP